jgi:hypothetical protein
VNEGGRSASIVDMVPTLLNLTRLCPQIGEM